MMDLIYKFLNKMLFKKKHEVLKLQWQKAELEKQLEQLKSANSNNN